VTWTKKRKDGVKEINKRRTINVDAVFDIETEDWTTFVCGGVYEKSGKYLSFGWKEEKAFVNYLLSLKGDVWAHNGGNFDDKWLLDHIVEMGLEARVIAAGSRIVALEVCDLKIYDSKALTQLSLKELTEGAQVSKEKLALTCVKKRDCDTECAGYCAISREMSADKLKVLLKYLKADCVSLMDALNRIKEYAESNELDLGITIGSSAWRNVKRCLGVPGAKMTAQEHMSARAGYYGGRVQLFRPKAHRGFEYDVNSMYPSRLAFCPVPTGNHEAFFGTDARKRFLSKRPGIWRAEVRVPKMHIPPLPFRHKGRVCYPTGTFEGSWTTPELSYALSLGVQVKVFEGIVWEGERVVFTDWVERLFALRSGVGKKSPIGKFLKGYLNSLTGKFGARPDNETIVINPPTLKFCKNRGPCEYECDGWCGCYTPTSSPNIFTEKRWRLSACSHIEWAAYLTSEARIEWHKQAVSVDDGKDVVYGDTDSLLTLSARTRNVVDGDDLGMWKKDTMWQNFLGMAPKVYTYEALKEDAEPALKVKAKGIRLPTDRKKAKNAILTGEPIGKGGPIGFKVGLKLGKFFQKSDLTRRVKQGYGDRILDAGSEFTRAPSIREANGYEDDGLNRDEDFESDVFAELPE
jgi:hypothetical protein